MGDRLRAGKLRLAIPLWVGAMSTSLGWEGNRRHHNWSATKQNLHPQSVAEISRHSVLSGDRIRQCGTSSGRRTGHASQTIVVYPPTGSTAYEREMSTPPTVLRSTALPYLYLHRRKLASNVLPLPELRR